MKHSNLSPSRRSLISGIGATALGSVAAGCLDSDTEGETNISTNVDIIDRADQRFAQLELSVTPTDDINRIHVMRNSSEAARIEKITNPMNVDVPLEGGRHYELEVVVDIGELDMNSERTTLDLGFVPRVDAPLHGDRTLCAHYYPWYGEPDNHEEWTEISPSTPELGEYDSRETETITRHLNWCEQAGIDWLSAAWWGPNSFTDETLLEYVLEIENAREFTWSVLYETEGRFDELPVNMDDEEPRATLASDLEYLEENYFHEPWYHTINGRPVFYIFVAFELAGDVAGAWQEATEPLDVDPYLIADIGNRSVPDVVPIVDAADAVTTYNPYQARDDIEEVFREETLSTYRRWFLGRESTGVDIMPTAIPGYDDSLIRDNPVLESNYELYDWCIRTARKYATNHDTVFITSFNEWYEDTQIEPSEEKEEHLLNVTPNVFGENGYEYPNFDGKILSLEFEESVPEPEITDSTESSRELTFLCEELSVEGPTGDTLDTYSIGSSDEPLILNGAYDPQTNTEASMRWFGGGTTTSLYLNELSTRYKIRLTGRAASEMEVSAYLNEEEIGSAQVGPHRDTYSL